MADYFVIRDGDGYEVEASDIEGARLALKTLQVEGHPYPLEILPDGRQPFGSYGRIDGPRQARPESFLPRRVIR
jgi:hypothetical protein